MIFISHKLDEVLAISDAITVIRAGRTVATVDAKSVNAAQLAELMIGSELPTPETTGSTIQPTVELELSNVTVRTAEGRALLDDVSLSVRRGEVVGVAGVEGNGQSELLEVVMGLTPLTSGSITFAGEDITSMATRERREAGIGYIPEDRHDRRPRTRRAVVGERHARTSDPVAVRQGAMDRSCRRDAAHEAIIAGIPGTHAGARGARARPLRR